MTPFFRRLQQRRAARRRVERVFHRSARDREAGHTVAADFWQAIARNRHTEFQREYPEARPDYIRTRPPRPSRWWWRVGSGSLYALVASIFVDTDPRVQMWIVVIGLPCLMRAVRLDSQLR